MSKLLLVSVCVVLLVTLCSEAYALDLEEFKPDEWSAVLLIAGGEMDFGDWSFSPDMRWAERATIGASWKIDNVWERDLFFDVLRPWADQGVGGSVEINETLRGGMGGFPAGEHTIDLSVYLRRTW